MRFCLSSTSGGAGGTERLEYEKDDKRLKIQVDSRHENMEIEIRDRSGHLCHRSVINLGILFPPEPKKRRSRS